MVVIGSANSSNTLALERTAATAGCARVLRVNGADELPDDLSGTVGVIAGASAPEELVQAVVARLDPRDGVEEVRAVDEDEYFPLPRELRDAARHLAAAAAGRWSAPPGAATATAGRGADRFPDLVARSSAAVAPRVPELTRLEAAPAASGPTRRRPALRRRTRACTSWSCRASEVSSNTSRRWRARARPTRPSVTGAEGWVARRP